MAKRSGFTLVELIIAVFIFGYMASSLATIYATSHRHMFQNYRANMIKTGTLVAMRAIQNNVISATRIDSPAPGAQGNVLAFAVNVDQMSGCYPINTAMPTTWHYFCLANDAATPGFQSFYYHTGTIGGGNACTNINPTIWNGVYPVPRCGASMPGQTVSKLAEYVTTPAAGGNLFSRRAAEGVNDSGSVRVQVRSFWPAASRGLGGAQRDIDFNLDTVMRVSRSQ